MGPADIIAAGAVVSRRKRGGIEVLLVHRPKYDDWSFPKGKLDPGEHVVTAAVREVAEETGLDIRLGPPLSTQRYTVRNGRLNAKDAHYWSGRVVGTDDVSKFRANSEVDEVAWVPVAKARNRLTYPRDRETFDEFGQVTRRSRPLVIVRHSQALPRASWDGDDRDRTLTPAGHTQSEQLVPLLGAYGVRHVLSSSSRRCHDTVAPYARVLGRDVEVTNDLSEEGAAGTTVRAHVERLLSSKEPTVLCTHRPVLPLVLAALGVEERELEQGDLLVVHHRNGKVVAVEHHPVTLL